MVLGGSVWATREGAWTRMVGDGGGSLWDGSRQETLVDEHACFRAVGLTVCGLWDGR